MEKKRCTQLDSARGFDFAAVTRSFVRADYVARVEIFLLFPT